MRKTERGDSYFFTDESGDAVFYDARGNLIVGQPGCSKLLIVGFIETQEPEIIRKGVLELQQEVLSEPYFKGIPSLTKTAIAFHAKDDAQEIRYLFYKRIKEFKFKAQFIVARKIEKVFRNDFDADENKFYAHLVGKAFENVLHRYQHNHITFSVRGSKTRQQPISQAILRAKQAFCDKYGHAGDSTVEIQPQSPKGEPCLSVIDYVIWALQRAYTKREMRYFDFIEDKVSYIADIYDFHAHPNNRYYHDQVRKRTQTGRKGKVSQKGNLFHIEKTTPL